MWAVEWGDWLGLVEMITWQIIRTQQNSDITTPGNITQDNTWHNNIQRKASTWQNICSQHNLKGQESTTSLPLIWLYQQHPRDIHQNHKGQPWWNLTHLNCSVAAVSSDGNRMTTPNVAVEEIVEYKDINAMGLARGRSVSSMGERISSSTITKHSSEWTTKGMAVMKDQMPTELQLMEAGGIWVNVIGILS